MVASVSESGFTVIEGNKGSASEVGYRQMKVNGRYIRGYCLPNFAALVRGHPGLHHEGRLGFRHVGRRLERLGQYSLIAAGEF